MARKANPPRYRHHRPSDRGYARFPRGDGTYHFVYFPGKYNSGVSLAAYAAAIKSWEQTGRIPAPERRPPLPNTLTVAELVEAFWEHVLAHGLYRKGGRRTSEFHVLRSAFRVLRQHYGDEPAVGMTAAKTETIRRTLIDKGHADKTVRHYLQRIRSLFAWGEEHLGLPPVRLVVRRGLGSKRPPRGRVTARKRPADLASVGAVAVVAGPPLCSMLWLQHLNGMRPQGVCAMRPCDIDRSGELWVYTEPVDEAAKTGGERHVLGPRAQAILRPYLEAVTNPNALLFRPNRRPGAAKGGYTVTYYRRHVATICRRLGLPHFSPGTLRHGHATRVRKLYGIEAARARLGHTDLSTTEIYAAQDAELASRVARDIG
jgi:integrase